MNVVFVPAPMKHLNRIGQIERPLHQIERNVHVIGRWAQSAPKREELLLPLKDVALERRLGALEFGFLEHVALFFKPQGLRGHAAGADVGAVEAAEPRLVLHLDALVVGAALKLLVDAPVVGAFEMEHPVGTAVAERGEKRRRSGEHF